jgi:A/G-specific adenine glycosylase
VTDPRHVVTVYPITGRQLFFTVPHSWCEECDEGLRSGEVPRICEPWDTDSTPAPKKAGTLRRGAAFIVRRGDELLVRTRAEKGLLGGMTEVPGSDWLAGQDDKIALKQAPELNGVARWHRKTGVVTHVFTHFPLELVIYTADVAARTRAPAGMRWVPLATLAGSVQPEVC